MSKSESSATKEGAAAQLRILCLEDNEGDFILLREYLKDADIDPVPELVRAETMSEAKALLESPEKDSSFDVVLLDLSLPDSNGEESLSVLTGLIPRTPITILSGNDDRDLAVKMVKEGAQDYLPKDSLNSELLTRSILYAVERQRSRTEMAELNERLKKATEDLKTAQMLLIQAEKMDSLGRLSAGVAHEVKNPLATLQLGVNFFDRKSDVLGEAGEVMVSHMQDAITRADRIICGMVDYSRSDTLKLVPEDVNGVVRAALELVQHEAASSNVKVVVDLADSLPPALIDQGKLEQVIINLMLNAIQALKQSDSETPDDSSEPGLLEIRTFQAKVEEIERDEGLRHFERIRAHDSVVVIEVRDHGPGIPKEKIGRIFEPFYTTKPTGEGTGLGLSVAKNIIDLHRGYIYVKNAEDGTGVQARILLKSR